jgi:hypothetical protein
LQTDEGRQERLKKAQEDYQLEDEHRGGHLANTLLELQKEDKTARHIGSADTSKKPAKAETQDATVAMPDATEVRMPPVCIAHSSCSAW